MMAFLCLSMLFSIVLGFSYLVYRDQQKHRVVHITNEMLSHPLTNQAVRHYITHIKSTHETLHAASWYSMRCAYEKIMQEATIDPKLKKEFKQVLCRQMVV